ncbi:MAG: ATP-binding cassette domain-containing protein [Alphaproteobacteria bacterium]|nr:ATP-binding cassette domain-containing protein [Alphaproteobacteria bacterium]
MEHTINPILSVKNLDLRRGDILLHKGINFDLHAGQGLCLRGPNGCGKTTLIHTLAGILSLSDNSTVKHTNHFFLPQEYALTEHASVQDNMTTFAKIMGVSALSEVDPFDIRSLLTKKVHTLSNGQKRRVSLSRLLMAQEKLWLLDEPDQGLDGHFKEVLGNVLQSHIARGGAVLIASHTFQGGGERWEDFMLPF